MSAIVVRYLPRDDQADENQRLIEDVFAELADLCPSGFAYTTWRLADGTFVHIAEVDGPDNPLPTLPAFQRFLVGVDDRCEPADGPKAEPATCIGAFRSTHERD